MGQPDHPTDHRFGIVGRQHPILPQRRIDVLQRHAGGVADVPIGVGQMRHQLRHGRGWIVDTGVKCFDLLPQRPQIGELALVGVDRRGRFFADISDPEQL